MGSPKCVNLRHWFHITIAFFMATSCVVYGMDVLDKDDQLPERLINTFEKDLDLQYMLEKHFNQESGKRYEHPIYVSNLIFHMGQVTARTMPELRFAYSPETLFEQYIEQKRSDWSN